MKNKKPIKNSPILIDGSGTVGVSDGLTSISWVNWLWLGDSLAFVPSAKPVCDKSISRVRVDVSVPITSKSNKLKGSSWLTPMGEPTKAVGKEAAPKLVIVPFALSNVPVLNKGKVEGNKGLLRVCWKSFSKIYATFDQEFSDKSISFST